MFRACAMIAFRHLVARRRQSLFTLLGLAVGVMVLISAVSMFDGLKVSFVLQMLQVSPHVTVYPDPAVPEPMKLSGSTAGVYALALPDSPDEEDELKSYRSLLDRLRRIPGVLTAAPEYLGEGFVVYGTQKRSAQIHGVIPELQQNIGNLRRRLVGGSYDDFQASPDGALVGWRLAQRLTIGVGDKFQAVGRAGELLTFRVSGLLKTGVTSYDSTHLLVHLDRAQQMMAAGPDRVTAINVRVPDPESADVVARRIKRALGRRTETWQEANAGVFSLFEMIGRTSYFLVVFTILAAGLGVSNMLTTVVLQKKKDIAVMMSMGYSRGAVSLIFLMEGVALGVAGALLGCLLGFINTHALAAIPMDWGEAAIISRKGLYMNQSVWYYVLSAAFGFVVSLAAGVAPARRAARLDPVTIIRQEV